MTPKITITPAAQARLIELTATAANHEVKPRFVRLVLKEGGCAGQEPRFELAGKVSAADMVINLGEVGVAVAPNVAKALAGTTVDYVTDGTILGARFTFEGVGLNTCGCGKSFNV
jgi:iron-sulfur cluster assembly accessory protein